MLRPHHQSVQTFTKWRSRTLQVLRCSRPFRESTPTLSVLLHKLSWLLCTAASTPGVWLCYPSEMTGSVTSTQECECSAVRYLGTSRRRHLPRDDVVHTAPCRAASYPFFSKSWFVTDCFFLCITAGRNCKFSKTTTTLPQLLSRAPLSAGLLVHSSQDSFSSF